MIQPDLPEGNLGAALVYNAANTSFCRTRVTKLWFTSGYVNLFLLLVDDWTLSNSMEHIYSVILWILV